MTQLGVTVGQAGIGQGARRVVFDGLGQDLDASPIALLRPLAQLEHAAQIAIVGLRAGGAFARQAAFFCRRQLNLDLASDRTGHFVLHRDEAVEFPSVALRPDRPVVQCIQQCDDHAYPAALGRDRALDNLVDA